MGHFVPTIKLLISNQSNPKTKMGHFVPTIKLLISNQLDQTQNGHFVDLGLDGVLLRVDSVLE
jgi:hypothetical protein